MKRAIFMAAVVAMVSAGCSHKSESGDRDDNLTPRSVAVAMAERVSASSVETYMGTVAAPNRADVGSHIQAPVARIAVGLGSRVRQDELLAELDGREYQARVDQAQAVYDQAVADLGRFSELVKEKAVAEQEFETVRSRKSVAEATLAEARTYLSYTRITAPFSGTVIQKQVDVGDLATPGRTLFTLEESGPSRFVTTLPESRLGRLKSGDSVSVDITSIGTTVTGWVDELSPSSDPVSHTFTVKIGLPAVADLRPGQFGRLRLPTSEDETIFIPRSALIKRGQLDLVYVVNDRNQAMLRLVRIGRQTNDRLEILAGLREGERVVVHPPRDLVDGDPVEVRP